MTSKGCAFLMDMGTGKTITTIALAGTLHHKHKITQMLVVCPKSIVDVWEQEFEKFADFPYQLAVLDGTSAKKADMGISFLKQANVLWLQIYQIVKDNCEAPIGSSNPNDDLMERLLG